MEASLIKLYIIIFPVLPERINKRLWRCFYCVGIKASTCVNIKETTLTTKCPVRNIKYLLNRKLAVLRNNLIVVQVYDPFMLDVYLFGAVYFSLHLNIRMFSYQVHVTPPMRILRYKFWINKRMTSAPPINVPSELPKFASTTTSKTRVTLLFQKPFRLKTSSDKLSKSLTLGRTK